MRPYSACGIYDLVVQTNAPSTAGSAALAIKDCLLIFEPRIDVLNIDVQGQRDGATLLIDIEYQVRATNNVFNLVYPFYLERSAT